MNGSPRALVYSKARLLAKPRQLLEISLVMSVYWGEVLGVAASPKQSHKQCNSSLDFLFDLEELCLVQYRRWHIFSCLGASRQNGLGPTKAKLPISPSSYRLYLPLSSAVICALG
jgi:hypothetical protein